MKYTHRIPKTAIYFPIKTSYFKWFLLKFCLNKSLRMCIIRIFDKSVAWTMNMDHINVIAKWVLNIVVLTESNELSRDFFHFNRWVTIFIRTSGRYSQAKFGQIIKTVWHFFGWPEPSVARSSDLLRYTVWSKIELSKLFVRNPCMSSI